MFRKVQGWFKGGKKTASSFSPTKGDKKKNRNKGRARSKTEGATPSQGFDDEFRRNNLHDFDIVISTGDIVDNDHNPVQDKPAEVPSPQPDSHSKEADTVSEDSLVDLVSKETETERPGDLSLDEMQTLDLLDSVVKDFDLEVSNDINELPNSNVVGVDSEEGGGNNEIQKTVVEAKEGRPIDFSHVLTNANGDSVSEPQQENWQAVEVNEWRKSFRFVPTNGMYLPSPELEESPPPDLPPTDYPQTDDDDDGLGAISNDQGLTEDNDDGEAAETSPESRTQVAVVGTSFSTIPDPSAASTILANIARVETFSSNGTVAYDKEPEVSKQSFDSPVSGGLPSSSAEGLSSQEGEYTEIRNGRSYSSPTPKHPKPRVTSFKSSSSPPTISVKPVTEMVRKFEDKGGF